MKKPSEPAYPLQPGLICGYFDQNQFRLGMILAVTDQSCQVAGLESDLINLPGNRLVLISDQVFPIQKPASTLAGFQSELDSCLAQIALAEIRSRLLTAQPELTLEDIIRTCSLASSDSSRFALFLALRAKPAWFRCKKGIYHAQSLEEEQAYDQAEEQKELHRRDTEACPLLARKGLPVLFTPALLHEAEQIGEYQEIPDRMDLTYLDCWTIDAEQSHDLDDAISLTAKEEGWELGIHITDVSFFFSRDSDLDLEAGRRTSSVYLPGQDVHMLPESISCRTASLLEGKLRPALSVVCMINPEWEISSYQVFPSQIRVTRNYSYEEFEAFLSQQVPAFNPEMRDAAIILQKIAEVNLHKRISQGAVVLEDSSLSPARQIVAECMVIYNSILADLVLDDDVPLFYRYLLEPASESGPQTQDPAYLPPSVLGTRPRPHTAMGLQVYAQFSSPLRRYSDLANQRQIKAFLNFDEITYTRDNLDKMIEHLAQIRRLIRQVTQQAESSQTCPKPIKPDNSGVPAG
jgi:hypothetical protein